MTNKVLKTKKISPMLKNKTILIAEDDYANRFYLQEVLKSFTENIIWAHNGQEAVDKYKEHENISVILMDIRMPILDGYEATKQILEINPKAKIIAQTSYAMASDREKCLKEGFSDYITKPINSDLLIDTLNKWINK